MPRFHRKLRNGLFDRSVERRPIFNEPPLPGVRGDAPDDPGVPRLESNPPSTMQFHEFSGNESKDECEKNICFFFLIK